MGAFYSDVLMGEPIIAIGAAVIALIVLALAFSAICWLHSELLMRRAWRGTVTSLEHVAGHVENTVVPAVGTGFSPSGPVTTVTAVPATRYVEDQWLVEITDPLNPDLAPGVVEVERTVWNGLREGPTVDFSDHAPSGIERAFAVLAIAVIVALVAAAGWKVATWQVAKDPYAPEASKIQVVRGEGSAQGQRYYTISSDSTQAQLELDKLHLLSEQGTVIIGEQ
jgi:hypothetical protein